MTPSSFTQERVVLSANALHFSRGGRNVIDNISCDILAGEVFGIVGPNGAGKSTLLSLLAGIEKPHQGEVRLHGKALLEYSLAELAKQRSYLEQDGHSAWSLTVKDLVSLGRVPFLGAWQSLSTTDEIAIQEAMAFTDTSQFSHREIYSLSGGERARVLLARALATQASLLISDEPIAALDVQHQAHILRLFRHLADSGKTVVVVLHDLNLALQACDRLAIMANGTVKMLATPNELVRSKVFDEVFQCTFRWGELDDQAFLFVSES